MLLGEQVLDEIDHEQRVALGATVNEPRQPLGEAGGRASVDRQVLLDGIFRQVLEWKLTAQPVRLQLALDCLQRMLAEDDIDRPVGADDDEPRADRGDGRDSVIRSSVE